MENTNKSTFEHPFVDGNRVFVTADPHCEFCAGRGFFYGGPHPDDPPDEICECIEVQLTEEMCNLEVLTEIDPEADCLASDPTESMPDMPDWMFDDVAWAAYEEEEQALQLADRGIAFPY